MFAIAIRWTALGYRASTNTFNNNNSVFLTYLSCFILMALGANGVNCADMPLNNKNQLNSNLLRIKCYTLQGHGGHFGSSKSD